MTARKTWRLGTRTAVGVGILCAGLLAAGGLAPTNVRAQRTTGELTGSVTADRGDVRALRVKAKDTIHQISYTIFTNKGQYHFYNLPASTYEVSVVEEDFDSPVRYVGIKAGDSTTANIALKTRGDRAAAGAGQRGSIAQTSYGRTADERDASQIEVVDFDVLYPPGPARDLMVKECFPCHGISGWHGRKLNKAGWTRVVNRMFAPDGRVANLAVGVPMITADHVTVKQKEMIVDYLTANFGPSSKPRDLKIDPLVRDESALSSTMYVQYELNRTLGPKFANGLSPNRGGHSAFVSLADPTVVWISGNSSNSIIRVNTRDQDFSTRTKEFYIENPGRINTTPHGIFERDGKVWFVELGGDHISELDPGTGRIQRYRMPTEGAGPHSVWPDSKGSFWYTYFAGSGKIAKFDPATKQVKEWEVAKGFSGYGLIVDKQDHVWAVSLNTPTVMEWNPSTEKWTSHAIAGPARRVTFDSKGMVWVCEYFANKIAMIDPATGKVTEYDMPLKWGNPYDIWPDADDNLWIENAVYNSIVKFDRNSKTFTYVPFPELAAHTPKLDRDREGTLWFTLGHPLTLTGLKPKGNVASMAGARSQ